MGGDPKPMPDGQKGSYSESEKASAQAQCQVRLDLRGVACPINFVKARLQIDKLAAGELLFLMLDDGEPIESVSSSLAAEGHLIEEQVKDREGHWRLVVRKV